MRVYAVIATDEANVPCEPLGPGASNGDLLAWALGRDRTKAWPPTPQGFVLVEVTSDGYGKGETPTFHLVCRYVA